MSSDFYELQFEIEHNCLLDCIHCSSVDMRKEGYRGYSDEDLLNFITCFQNPLYVYLTGGDPILYEGLLSLTSRIKSVNPNTKIGLYTTGINSNFSFITLDYALKMKESGIEECYLSIYSNDKKEHDEWTRKKNSFKNTIASVRILNQSNICAKAHVVLSEVNKNKIEQVIEFCYDVGFTEVRLLSLTPSGAAIKHWQDIGISLEEQNEIVKKLVNKKDEFSGKISFSGYPELHPCRPINGSYKCQAGSHLLYIDANGDIYPCACAKKYPEKYRICHITEKELIEKYIFQNKKSGFESQCFKTRFNQ